MRDFACLGEAVHDTAAATFKRGTDLWIVFSRYRDVNAGLLSTVMPTNVIGITQYADKDNTILRIATDGSLNTKAIQIDKSYGWNITLTKARVQPTLDVAVSADSLEGTMRLILGVFDLAPALRFYDPTVGDQFTILPAFENGRAVSTSRNYPEFGILATSQGIALVSKRPDLEVNQTRAGLIIGAKTGLAVSDNLPILAGKSPVAVVSACTCPVVRACT